MSKFQQLQDVADAKQLGATRRKWREGRRRWDSRLLAWFTVATKTTSFSSPFQIT
jgi:hypothetical protein